MRGQKAMGVGAAASVERQSGAIAGVQERTAYSARQTRPLRLWLYFICFLIGCTVVVGGATRLTDSGLSITEWKPIHGVIPPLSLAEWEEEFAKYRQIPQYEQINAGMSLAQFQFIFWWEWAHRLLGRFIGLAFFVPMVVFWMRGQVPQWLKPHLVVALGLGGLQGAIGWWMVSSGLVDRVDVSQYRLAVHLSVACVLFAYLFSLARMLVVPVVTQFNRGLERGAQLLILLVLIQIFLGALVAGLNAGMAYNTWPLMDGAFLPGGMYPLSPWWLNHFENVKLVQFQHRMMAYLLLLLAGLYLWVVQKHVSAAEAGLRRVARLLETALVVQIVLGIMALLSVVRLDWALAHQGCALVVLAVTCELWVRQRRVQGDT
ncbi:COX15/CtaA family protein [Polycladidibacter hongkongensis]|uniref:COX15/CtaA family protein n=1 Tax=Polycladidibacter hongkongensis TaxID=1647556 RepID=UPI000ABCD86A|nr:COX15/CtaA family protein [Pseudovibrio hongkongensis]